jgi:hypothetical protein
MVFFRSTDPAKSLRDTLAVCQVCRSGLNGHRLHELFQFFEPTELKVADIDQEVKSRNWRIFVGEKTAGPSALFAYWFVECPEKSSGGLYRVYLSADFDVADQLDPAGALDAGETARLLATLGNEKPLAL